MNIHVHSSSLRIVLTVLTAITALHIGLIAVGNVTDFNTNHAFVEHVFAMDTTYGSPGMMWRAINNSRIITVAYLCIITWELITFIILAGSFFCWLMAMTMRRGLVTAWQLAVRGWLLEVILFGGGFITIGGEWFQMWQSPKWNGLQPALQNFLIASTGLILAHLLRPDSLRDARFDGT